MRQWCPVFVPGLTIEVEMEGGARCELDRPFGKGPQTEFRSLQVRENADWPPGRILYPSDRFKPGAMVVMCAMAEVEPEDVYARLE
jgi:hypothetical protein